MDILAGRNPEDQRGSIFRWEKHPAGLDEIARVKTGMVVRSGGSLIRRLLDHGVNGGATTLHGEFVHGPGSSGGVMPEHASLQGHQIADQRGGIPASIVDGRRKVPG
jgi:hypothetical protein